MLVKQLESRGYKILFGGQVGSNMAEKNAQTVYRNRDGRRIDREEWVELQQKKRKKRASDYPEQELEWGGGLKQRDNREEEKEDR